MHLNPKVLVVEDDRQQARYFQLLLHRYDPPFEVDIASDAPEALDKLAGKKYDVLTIDYHLPSMTGLELLVQIKKQYSYLPIIMVTGQGDEQVAVEAMRKGAQDYLTKSREYLELMPRILLRAIRENSLAKQLEESRHRYYELFHNANIAIFVIDAETIHIQQMNKCAEHLLGLPYELGRQKAFFNLVSPDQQTLIENLFKNIRENGNATAENVRLLHQQKRIIPTDINGSYLQSNEHRLIELFVTDIREKLAMMRQLQLSQHRLLSLFNGITDMICVLTTDYKLLMGNKRYLEFTGNTSKSITNKKCYETLFNRQTPCDICPALKTYDTGDSHFVEIYHDNRIYHIWTFPMQSHDGRPEYIVEYAKDVTEDKELERQLIKAEKLASIGLLSSGIAHELRNPLNIIETARYSIETSLEQKTPEIEQKLSVIKSNVQRSSAIIDNLLQFSRHSDLKKEQIDLSALVKSTISLLHKEMMRVNIIPTVTFLGETLSVYLNLDSLKQVFLNIIQNAIHAMPHGGHLQINTYASRDKKWMTVEFTDDGQGISEKNLKHIFTPFFTTKAPNEGTGLGLYLSYTLLKREGGDIQVESTLGTGSTFRVQLPVVEER
ncbi:response regulator [candidate division KSB1 bacterium]|nr:response regulator [candidate division KSB1 bacterium]RQV99930.1 MAG: response regulator [candidate division KSB1 bacterium]